MNPALHNDNIKKVLRIALVGIRPADQVILKGYLRLLMRLEADLEWVSANHEAVDLFMVNSEFQHAESVQRLLVMHPNSSVLYISRTETENGFLMGNVLTLPMKDLEPLNQWLYGNLRLLFGKTAPKASTQQPNQTSQNFANSQTKRQSLDDLIASRQNQAVQPAIPKPAPANLNTGFNLDAIHKDKNIAIAVAKIVSRLNKKEDQLFSLNAKNGTFLAYIQPKQQRIWQLKPLTEVGEWTLNVANPTALNINASEDLVQFFWQFGLNNAKFFEPIINRNTQYHIDSWVKPEHNEQQNLVLKIQCVLEARHATFDEIVQLTNLDENTVQDILIALVLSGVMYKDVYESLNQTVQASDNHTPEVISVSPTTPVTPPPTPKPTTIPTSQATSHLQQEIRAEQPQSVKKDEGGSMKGFLSRLRSKLGI